MTDGGTCKSGISQSDYPPVRDDHYDIACLDDGSIIDVIRVHYHREADESGVCPFCRSADNVEFVREIRCESAKSRFECECGAFGEKIWTWKAGTIAATERGEKYV
jgi:hypothetical protein